MLDTGAYNPGASESSRQRQTMPLELCLLGAGLLLCIGVATRSRFILSDRFYYPKEFALHLFALAMALTAVMRGGAVKITRLDLLLLGFLGWSAIAALGAANPWWAQSAVGATAAGLVVFWVSRSLRDRGHERILLGIVAVAVAIVAGAAVLEAYGAIHVSVGMRAPGGVLGNRNSMAHVLVLGTPTLLLFAIGLRRRVGTLLAAVALLAIAMALVLSRTRGAWLTAMILAGWVVLTLPLTWRVVRHAVSRRRAALWAGATMIGVVAAVYLPNRLAWRSASPYASTLSRILDLEKGTGRGRLLQHGNTVRMIRDHPLLGVGPGNWSVLYAQYAPPGDPSLYPRDVVPVWRFPSGEWIGIAADVGLPGLAILLPAGWMFVRSAWRGMRRRDDDRAVLRALALSCTLVALALIGTIDPVFRTPAVGFLMFMILGVLAPREPTWFAFAPAGPPRWLWAAGVLIVLAPGVVLTGRQLWAALLYSTSATPTLLTRAVSIYPGDYRAHVLLATAWVDRHRCDLARPYIERALTLYPTAGVPTQLHIQCVAVQTGGP